MFISSFSAVKSMFEKMQNFFAFGRIFFKNLQTTPFAAWQQCLQSQGSILISFYL
jgi:hypothetical protein